MLPKLRLIAELQPAQTLFVWLTNSPDLSGAANNGGYLTTVNDEMKVITA